MNTSFKQKLLAGLLFFTGAHGGVLAQADLCSGVGASTTLTINNSCTTTNYNVASGFGTEIASPSCCTSFRDGWYRFTTSATQNFVSITATTNRNLGIAVYSGTCGSLTEVACIDAGGANVTEVLNMAVSPSTTYYVRLIRSNNNTANNMTGTICIVSPTTTTTCSATFLDNGGAGNYPLNSNYMVTYCPATAGQCISASFSMFDVEDGYDFLEVFDGNSPLSAPLSGSPFTGTSIGTLTATTSNTSGCLTFWFTSDDLVVGAGWSANISCATCAAPTAALAQDCFGGTTVCSDAAFSGNSSGSGNDVDLDASNMGCLSGENQSSWYYFSPSASGTVALNITPSDPTDDYDFAIWGPMATITCPPNSNPVRCSYAGTTGTTGLDASAGAQTSEGALGDGFVGVLNVVAGEKYILLVDNYSASTSPFTLDWTLSGGASLNCTVLPVQLVNFTGEADGDRVRLNWESLSETHNNFYTIEKSVDGNRFYELGKIPGAGTVTTAHGYESFDDNPANGVNYYRLSQTDFDGNTVVFNTIQVVFNGNAADILLEVYPVPATDEIQVVFNDNILENTNVYITDITGRVLLSEQIDTGGNTYSMRLETLGKGVYFLVAENRYLNRKSAVKKIVIE